MIANLAELGDAWWTAEPEQRAELARLARDRENLRRELRRGYLSLVIEQITATHDGQWYRRGLALVDLTARGDDIRDTIVTLVLLRHAAEQAGLDAVAGLAAAAIRADETLRAAFINARDHAPADVAATVRAFGGGGPDRITEDR